MSFNIISNNVENYANLASFPATGEDNIIYIDTATNTAYYWNGVDYQSISGGAGSGGTFAVDLDGSLTNVIKTIGLNIVTYTVTHNLNTLDYVPIVRATSFPPSFVGVEIYAQSVNNTVVKIALPVSDGDYRLIIKY
tara:strand:- start:1740 stop:2150 length:411 start_codon:yes stop_codon:yes gene_type:complete